jgi:phage terminase small subunit
VFKNFRTRAETGPAVDFLLVHVSELLCRMGRRGPIPKSAEGHRLQGSFQPVRHADREQRLEAPGDLSKINLPKHLSQRERSVWRQTLDRAPWLRPCDADVFAAYCRTVAELEQLSAARLGHETMGRPVPPELEKSLRAATRQLAMLATALSLTPGTRQRLFMSSTLAEPAEGGRDVWSELRHFPGARSKESIS